MKIALPSRLSSSRAHNCTNILLTESYLDAIVAKVVKI